ncbi:MAG: CDP-diacylglycerol--glycerol-3-phosphate 3-phosphatidyltransferase [Pseudomonadota bacterium]|nr:CDP-diacylglycerol--glycerol-3-phosphate 3-phosphatidyltransferase [Pseudomonadota bacterium]
MKHEFWNIPNSVTIARLALLPLVVLCHFWEYTWGGLISAIIFGIAASTDWVDGYLARKLNLTTPFGAFLDPVADKLMVVTALVLQVEFMDTWWFTLIAVVIICREVTISALREWMAEIGSRRKVAVQMLGKIKTVFQMVAISLLFLYQSWEYQPLFYLIILLFLVAVVFTLWSMFIYLVSAWRAMNEDDDEMLE